MHYSYFLLLNFTLINRITEEYFKMEQLEIDGDELKMFGSFNLTEFEVDRLDSYSTLTQSNNENFIKFNGTRSGSNILVLDDFEAKLSVMESRFENKSENFDRKLLLETTKKYYRRSYLKFQVFQNAIPKVCTCLKILFEEK